MLIQVGAAEPLVVVPGANALRLSVGDEVTFVTTGTCAGDISFVPQGTNVFGAFGATTQDATFGTPDDGELLTAARTGTDTLDVRLPNCGGQDAGCRGGVTGPLATIVVTVVPATPSRTAEVTSAAPSPLPTDASGCPTVPANGLAGDISGTSDQEAAVVSAAIQAVPRIYGTTPATRGFQVTSVYLASLKQGYGVAADGMCGKTLGDESYVVELHFPNSDGSASISNGQLFIAQFADVGWQVWFRYR